MPPGTGKTYNTINKALEIIDPAILVKNSGEADEKYREKLKSRFDDFLNGRIVFTTFHQSMSYEDFIEGIKPTMSNRNKTSDNGDVTYHIEDGIFKKLCKEASKEDNKQKNFVLIIDEINRGNVSQIFGELITLIEDDKRIGKLEALEVTLPYSKEPFGVPSNVFIIGTMNTADRSVEALDAALRRRFSFEEMPPRPDLIQVDPFKDPNLQLPDILKTINKRIEKLLDKDHQIGHSYFMSNSASTIEGVKNIFQNKIIPLLQEYFFGDYGKIGLVLGKGFFENEDSKIEFAEFFKDYDSSDFSGKIIYKMKDVSKMDENEFIKAIYLLLKIQPPVASGALSSEELSN